MVGVRPATFCCCCCDIALPELAFRLTNSCQNVNFKYYSEASSAADHVGYRETKARRLAYLHSIHAFCIYASHLYELPTLVSVPHHRATSAWKAPLLESRQLWKVSQHWKVGP